MKKKMDNIVHPSLHLNLQTRLTALKGAMSWTSQLLWIFVFSPEKWDTFFLLQCDVRSIKCNDAWEVANDGF